MFKIDKIKSFKKQRESLNKYKKKDKVPQQTWLLLKTITPLNIFLLDVNFNKFTIRLHFIFMYSIFAKFSENQRLIVISSIKCSNFKFL